MKPIYSVIVFLVVVVVACAPLQVTQPSSVDLPTSLPAAAQPADESVSQGSEADVEAATADGISLSTTPTSAAVDEAAVSSGAALPMEVTFLDNGSTFAMQVGESFLLKLDTDGYTWIVDVDRENVIQRDINAMGNRDAQEIYVAKNPGTAILTASGDPLCRQSRPACMRPTILFSVTVIVQ